METLLTDFLQILMPVTSKFVQMLIFDVPVVFPADQFFFIRKKMVDRCVFDVMDTHLDTAPYTTHVRYLRFDMSLKMERFIVKRMMSFLGHSTSST